MSLLRNFGQVYSRRIIDGNPKVKTDLKLSQIKALYAFRDRDRLSMKELAYNIGVKLPNMTMMIDGLLQEGIVERDRDEHDRRKVIVWLTPKGKKLRADFLSERQEIARELFAKLNERDRKRLLTSLSTVCQIMDKAFSDEVK